MAGTRDRALSIVELLAKHVDGLAMSEVADELLIPRSATHRLLQDLQDTGYVRQVGAGGRYMLTVKLVSMALTYLAATGMPDIAQPLLDKLAASTGELVRLAVVDGNRLVYVAKAQGARAGLRYDPEQGLDVYLPASASGHVWLANVDSDRALELVATQGFQRDKPLGPSAPKTFEALMKQVRSTRERGYGLVMEAYEVGTCAVAAVIKRPRSDEVIGTVSVAGPSVRLSRERLEAMSPDLLQCAADLATAGGASPLFAVAQPLPVRVMEQA